MAEMPGARPPPGLTFLTPPLARRIMAQHGTPCFVYDEAALRANAARATGMPHAFGLTVRFAMKARAPPSLPQKLGMGAPPLGYDAPLP